MERLFVTKPREGIHWERGALGVALQSLASPSRTGEGASATCQVGAPESESPIGRGLSSFKPFLFVLDLDFPADFEDANEDEDERPTK